ncbi:MAG: hypothetical protein FJ098_06985 [Deltaproteobacteria bacterium]|nr:hypothetical protein [Deltaproteobacteria bacterium]
MKRCASAAARGIIPSMPCRLFLTALLLAGSCGRQPPAEPLELSSLLPPEDAADPAELLPLCPPPVLELRLEDWQAVLDGPLEPGVSGGPTLRRILRRWVPASLLSPGPGAATLTVRGLEVGVDAEAAPVVGFLDAELVVRMEAGEGRQALVKDLEAWRTALASLLPPDRTPVLTLEEDGGGLTARLRAGAPTRPPPQCRPVEEPAPAGAGLRLRVGLRALLRAAAGTAGTLLLWSVLPEELGRWETLDLVVRPGAEDRIALVLDAGDGALPGLLRRAHFPAQPGWETLLPPAAPLVGGFVLTDAEAFAGRLSDLFFEKGFKLRTLDPEEILDRSWQTQLAELLSGPALLVPMAEELEPKTWDEGWAVYLQPKDLSELQGRLRRVFDLKRYVTGDEDFRQRRLTVVRYRGAKGNPAGVRFAWYCGDSGCWIAPTLGTFDRLFGAEEAASSPPRERVRSLLADGALAFAVLSPQALGERFRLPAEKKKPAKKKKKGFSLPGLDGGDMARSLVENAVRGALTALPAELLIDASLREEEHRVQVEARGLFRAVGRLADAFLPLL